MGEPDCSPGLSFPLRNTSSKVPSTPWPAGWPGRSTPRCRTALGVSVHSPGRQGRCQPCQLGSLRIGKRVAHLEGAGPRCGPSDACTQTPLLRPEEPAQAPGGPAPGSGSPGLSIWRHPSPAQPLPPSGPLGSPRPSALWNAAPLRVAAPSEPAAIVPWPPPAASHLGQFMGHEPPRGCNSLPWYQLAPKCFTAFL